MCSSAHRELGRLECRVAKGPWHNVRHVRPARGLTAESAVPQRDPRVVPGTAKRWTVASILLAAFSSVACAGEITGTVQDSMTFTPIADAMVTWQASGVRSATGPNGEFALTIPDGTGRVIVAAAKGYYNASVIASPPSENVVILLSRVPQDDDPNYQFINPTTCGFCHPNQYEEWFGSPMHFAGTNAWVDDLYSGLGTPGGMGGYVYVRDSIFAAANPVSECAACHQPQRWIQTPFSALADPTKPRTQDILHGVSCDVCHKVADVDVEKINFPGIFPGAVTFTRPAGPSYHQVQYGLLGDVDYSYPGLMRASYQPQLSAEVCATCHQDASDPHGNHTYTGPISEPTYLEWLKSPYGDPQSPTYATCVDCHMPPSGRNTVCEMIWPPLIRDPQTIRSHRVEGTTAQYLENAVDLAVQLERDGPYIHVRADITNSMTGHHVPTGVTVRNMILLIEAWRVADARPLHFASGEVVHELGGVGNPAEGYYAGLPGKLFAKIIEDFDGNSPTFFTDAAAIIFDNRIPAMATDTSEYAFVAPGGGGTVRVRARLIYRRSFRALVDAKNWTQDGHGRPLGDLQPPDYGHLMAMAEHTLAIVRGDGNGDDEVNLIDFQGLHQCLLGVVGQPLDAACLVFDEDGDDRVDLLDFAGFQSAFGGS